MQLEIEGSLAERGEYTMLVVPADGSPAFVETGKHIVVRRRIEGEWVSVIEILERPLARRRSARPATRPCRSGGPRRRSAGDGTRSARRSFRVRSTDAT